MPGQRVRRAHKESLGFPVSQDSRENPVSRGSPDWRGYRVTPATQDRKGHRGLKDRRVSRGSRGLRALKERPGLRVRPIPRRLGLVPAEAEEGRPTIKVLGAGWQEDEAVTIEVFGPDGYHMIIGGALADASGTFETDMRPPSRESEGGPFMAGLHSVVVLGSKEGGASAPLMIVVPEPEPEPTAEP